MYSQFERHPFSKDWKCKFPSQVNVVNQEFVSFMSPPSVSLSPDKFDLLGQPRSRQAKRKGNAAWLAC